MTLTRLELTGSDAGFAVRAAIEGCPYEFVSAAGMATTAADGRIRLNCLDPSSITIEETAVLSEGTIDASPIELRMLDRHPDDILTKIFAQAPDGTRYLTADLTTSGTAITLDSTSGIVANDHIHVGTETIKVGTVASSTSLTGCTRARWSTTAQAHYKGNNATYGPQEVSLGRPPTLGGRRVRLYFYGAGDSLTGDGQLRWQGIITIDPALDDDGAFWTLHADPLTYLFEENLGADLGDPITPRGIYYSDGQPLYLIIQAHTSGAHAVAFSGFWETQEEFVTDLNTYFTANVNGTLGITTMRAVIRDSGAWDLELVLGVSPATQYIISAQAPQDGELASWFSADGSTNYGNLLLSPTASATYRITRGREQPDGAGQVPRGTVGRPTTSYADHLSEITISNLSGASPRRIYLGGDVVPASLGGCEIQWADGSTTQHSTSTFGAADRYVELDPPPVRWWTPATLPEIRLKHAYATGGLRDFRDSLVANSPTYANLGTMPFIHTDDLDNWNEAAEAERDIPVAASRVYTAIESVKLGDFLEQEFRLRAVAPRLTLTGKIGLTRLRLPSQTDVASHTITEADIVWDGTAPRWQRNNANGEGTINTVVFKLNYDAAAGEHVGRSYAVVNRQGIASRKQSRELEIAPIAEPLVRGDLESRTYDQYVRLAQPVLSVFGAAYYTIDVPVMWKHFRALVGDTVSLTCSTIPDVSTGTRGVTELPCLVVGRTWELGTGRGALRLMASMSRVWGYSPSLTISSQVDLGSNLWRLNMSFNDPLNLIPMWPTSLISDHFAVGDVVRAIEWDDAAPTSQTGAITSIDDGLVRVQVQFDGVWTPGTLNVLEADSATQIDGDSAQAKYAFLGDAAAFVAFSDGDDRAGGFAP